MEGDEQVALVAGEVVFGEEGGGVGGPVGAEVPGGDDHFVGEFEDVGAMGEFRAGDAHAGEVGVAVEAAFDVVVDLVGRPEVGDGLVAVGFAVALAEVVGAVIDAPEFGGAGAEAEFFGVADAGGEEFAVFAGRDRISRFSGGRCWVRRWRCRSRRWRCRSRRW